jgi:hypothetical protein
MAENNVYSLENDPIWQNMPIDLSFEDKLKLLKDKYRLQGKSIPADELTRAIQKAGMDKAHMDEISNIEEYKTDPGTALRMARNSAKARQAANVDKAIAEFYQSQDDFDRTFNPESYAMRRSGLGKISMPVGGRAGMANLHRPRYIEDMNQSIKSPVNISNTKEAMRTANTLEAERNETAGWLKGSEQHRVKLENTIADYDRQIAKLQAEMAMSEAGDPLYDLAVMRLIMDDDASLLNSIRSRIDKKIDQEFQMKQKKADQEFTASENEKNRQSTERIAGLNKAEQEASRQQDLEDAVERAKDVYMSLRRKLSNIPEEDPRRPEIEDQMETAQILMKQAYRKAKKLNEYDELMGNRFEGEDTIGERKTMLYKSLGVADDKEFQELYNSGDAEQKTFYEKQAKYLSLPLTKLGVSGTKAKDTQKKEQNEKAVKTKKDFKDKNAKKTFAVNILDGKAEDTQAWINFQKDAKNAGWTVELQPDGTILWK